MRSVFFLAVVFAILSPILPRASALGATSVLDLMTFVPSVAGQGQEPKQTVAIPTESALMKAIRARTETLTADAGLPSFELTYLCDRRLAVVHPQGHDLQLFAPTLAGASVSKVGLEQAFDQIFDWLDRDYMLPTAPVALQAGMKSTGAEDPLVLLLLNRLSQRELFNIRYSGGGMLEQMVYHSLLPFSHEDCRGVPCAKPGSCSDVMGCLWEVHVPLCEFVNRGTARLLERRYGPLPEAVLGLSEIVEVLVTGGHYAYRNWGNQQPLLPHSERDGYRSEFDQVLKKRYAKKKQRELFLVELLGWEGGYFSTEKYAASWGLGQVLLGHLKTSGKGKGKRSLGDLLSSIGRLEDPSAQAVLDVILEYDPKFLDTFRKRVAKKLLRKDRIWLEY